MGCHTPSFLFAKGNKEVKSHFCSALFQNLSDPHWALSSKQSLGNKATSIYWQSEGVMQIDSRLRWNWPTLSKPYIAWTLQTHTLLIYYKKKKRFGIFVLQNAKRINCDTLQCLLSSTHISRNVESFGDCFKRKRQWSGDLFPSDCWDRAQSLGCGMTETGGDRHIG